MSNPELIICLGEKAAGKDETIEKAVRLLADAGCIPLTYAESMKRREKTDNTYLGSGVAIPHGELADKNMVKKDGIAVIQVPEGVQWGKDDVATLVVAIAAKTDAHIDILTRLTGIIMNKEALQTVNTATEVGVVRSLLLDSENSAENNAPVEDDYSEAFTWKVNYPSGLHARPASIWVEKAKAAGIPMRIRNKSKNKTADPCSLVSLLNLNVKVNDTLVISAEGDEAKSVLESFRRDITALTAIENAKTRKISKRITQRAWVPEVKEREQAQVISGVAAAPGLAIGSIYYFKAVEVEVPDKAGDITSDGEALEKALQKTRAELERIAADTEERLSAAEAEIFKAQAGLLDDDALISACCRLMAQGHGVAWSWQQSIEAQAQELAGCDTELLAGRAIDLRDVGIRVLKELAPELDFTENKLPDGKNIVIAAEDLTPSDTAQIDTDRVVALATVQGGSTSHTAILARTLGLAAVVAAGGELLTAENGSKVIIDGDGGKIWLNPAESILTSARAEIKKRTGKREAMIERRGVESKTSDGKKVTVAANINTPEQAPLALEMGAEGVGLMRTEFLFIEQNKTFSEDEQYRIYCEMAKSMNGKEVVIRTLDIGGDKPVAHLQLVAENNPFLGVRGSRLLLRRRDIFEPQMRALYRAAKEYSNISVMFPMITSVGEIKELKAICASIRKEVAAPKIRLGIMIEVPAAAVMADLLAKHVDFFSIGTNDLTQYVLAMDRQNPELACEVDSLHPAVLRMIKQTVDGAMKYQRPVSVCGSIAGDPQGAALLVGLGVSKLSMAPREIPEIKELMLENSSEKFAEMAAIALEQDSADAVCEEFQQMFSFA